MQITIQISGVTEVQSKIKALGDGLYQLDEGMRQIGEYMSNYFGNEAFASQGQVFNGTWPRLSMKYSIWKAKNFPGRPPEVRTGKMKGAFAYTAGSQSVKVGNNMPYFKFQEEGTGRGLPARRMMGVNDANKRMIADILGEQIRQKISNV